MRNRRLLLFAFWALFGALSLETAPAQPFDVNAWAKSVRQFRDALWLCVNKEYFRSASKDRPSNEAAELAFSLCHTEEQALIATALSNPYLDHRRVIADLTAWKAREKAEMLKFHELLLSTSTPHR